MGSLIRALRRRFTDVSGASPLSPAVMEALDELEDSVSTLKKVAKNSAEQSKASTPDRRNSRDQSVASSDTGGEVSSKAGDIAAAMAAESIGSAVTGSKPYEFDRKFLFKLLCLGNAQLAQVVGARGPNTQMNAACAGTTQAIGMAQDMMRVGRCERVIVVAGDNASGKALLPWLANGFRALGAASTAGNVSLAALPFDARRNGMLLGAGAIGMVLETEAGFAHRQSLLPPLSPPPSPASAGGAAEAKAADGEDSQDVRARRAKCRLLATQYSNSAYHGAALSQKHIASELQRFLATVEGE